MPWYRNAFLIAAPMFAAGVGAIMARPTARPSDQEPAISLETIVPKQFGDWREEPQRTVQVVKSQTKELLNKLYTV